MAFVKFHGHRVAQSGHCPALVLHQGRAVLPDELLKRDAAPKTLNRRISSLSSFYKYLAAAAAELRLPITVPNLAHAQFISRESTDARDETRALSANRPAH
jgi:site-specific recombinase XerD